MLNVIIFLSLLLFSSRKNRKFHYDLIFRNKSAQEQSKLSKRHFHWIAIDYSLIIKSCNYFYEFHFFSFMQYSASNFIIDLFSRHYLNMRRLQFTKPKRFSQWRWKNCVWCRFKLVVHKHLC